MGEKTMRRSIVVSLVVVAALGIGLWAVFKACAARPTTVLLLRHADREPGMDQLSTAGVARARRLADALSGAEVPAIYQTQYMRTQQTAAPLAALLGITPVQLDAGDSDAVARDIRKHRAG